MNNIIAIDPGNTQSALLELRDGKVGARLLAPNDDILTTLAQLDKSSTVVIEWIACYGMIAGAELFETAFWAGRFWQAWPGPKGRLYRQSVKLHLCHSARAKDSNVRAALIERFGGVNAVGNKACPGPLYGLRADIWAALGVAVTWADGVRSEIKGMEPRKGKGKRA